MSQRKILFEHRNSLEGDYGLESAWAESLGENQYILDNILFYAPEYSLGDVVYVEEHDGQLLVKGLVKPSGHSTIRLIINSENEVNKVREELKNLGCSSEISDSPILIAVDVPSEVKYSDIKEFLIEGEKLGRFSYEESCIGHSL